MPTVYNVRNPFAPKSARYIGRGTPWGNPFIIGNVWRGRRMTRDDVCDRFETEILPGLSVEELRGFDLLCHCAPMRCHGDAILKKANS